MPVRAVGSGSPASADRAFVSVLPLAVSGSRSSRWKDAGTMYAGSSSPTRSRSVCAVTASAPV